MNEEQKHALCANCVAMRAVCRSSMLQATLCARDVLAGSCCCVLLLLCLEGNGHQGHPCAVVLLLLLCLKLGRKSVSKALQRLGPSQNLLAYYTAVLGHTTAVPAHLNMTTTATCTIQKQRQMMILTMSRAMTMIANTSSQKTVKPRFRLYRLQQLRKLLLGMSL